MLTIDAVAAVENAAKTGCKTVDLGGGAPENAAKARCAIVDSEGGAPGTSASAADFNESSEASIADSSSADPIKALNALDFSQVPAAFRGKLRELLRDFTPMWDGSLGEINTTEHAIDLHPGTRPIASLPCRAGPRARQEEDAEVQKCRRCCAML